MAATASGGNVLHQIEIQIVGSLNLLVQNLQNAQNQTTKTTTTMQTSFQKVTSTVSQLGDKLRILPSYFSQLAGVAGMAFGLAKVKSFIEEIVRLAARVEVLEIVTAQIGKVSGYSAAYIDNLVKSIEKMNITTQQANLSVALMIQANLDLAKATQLARVAQDAAVIANVSSQEALQGLVHGIITLQPRILRTYNIIVNLQLAYRRYASRLGIAFDELEMGVKQQIALNEVLRVGERIQGTYLAAMTKAGKQLLSLQRLTEQFKLAMGREFQDGFARLITTLYKFLDWAEKSENIKAAFRSVANVLDNLAQKVMWFVVFIAKHPNFLLNLFNIVILSGIIRSVGLLTANLVKLVAVMRSGVLMNQISILVGLSAALGYALSKLPLYISAITAVLSPLAGVMLVFQVNVVQAARAILSFNSILALTATTLPGFLGLLGLIAGVVSLLFMALRPLGQNANQASDDLARMKLEATNAANSSRDLRIQALELTKEFIALYESTDDYADKQKDLKETMDDLKKMLPEYLIGIDDVDVAYKKMKESLTGLVKETAELTAQQLILSALQIRAKLGSTYDEAKKRLAAYNAWVKKELVIIPVEGPDIVAKAYELFGEKIATVTDKIKELQSQMARGEDITAQMKPLREEWDSTVAAMEAWIRTDQVVTDTHKTADIVTQATIRDWGLLTEGVVQGTEAYSELQKELTKTNQQLDTAREIARTGFEFVGPMPIPKLQKEDLRELEDTLGRLTRLGLTWKSKALEPTLRGIIEEIQNDVDSGMIELAKFESDIRAMMSKAQYAKDKDKIKEFQDALALIGTIQGQILAAQKRLIDKGTKEWHEGQRDNNEKILKNEVDSGKQREAVLRAFYLSQIEIIDRMGSKATQKDLEQRAAYAKSLTDLDEKALDRQEKFYKFMLKYDSSYYDKLIELQKRKLPSLEKRYTRDSEEYRNALVDIQMLGRAQVMANAEKYEKMAGDDGRYYANYISALDAAMEDAQGIETLGLDFFKELQAKKQAAEEDFLRWRIAEWRKHYWYMGGVLDMMENSFSSMIQSFTDMELTGKHRREQIWEASRSAFIRIIGEMIQKWITFMLLTQLFPGTFGGMSFGQFLGGRGGGGGGGGTASPVGGGRGSTLPAGGYGGLDIQRYLGRVLPALSPLGNGQTSVLLNLNKAVSRLSESLNSGLVPVRVEMKPAMVVDSRGIYLATMSGTHKNSRVAV